jgi:hypothetical protein
VLDSFYRHSGILAFDNQQSALSIQSLICFGAQILSNRVKKLGGWKLRIERVVILLPLHPLPSATLVVIRDCYRTNC